MNNSDVDPLLLEYGPSGIVWFMLGHFLTDFERRDAGGNPRLNYNSEFCKNARCIIKLNLIFFQVNTNLVDRFKRRFGSKSTLNSNFTKYSKKKRGLFSSNGKT